MRKMLVIAVLAMLLFSTASAQSDARNGIMDRVSDLVDRAVQAVTGQARDAAVDAYTPTVTVEPEASDPDGAITAYKWSVDGDEVATTEEDTIALENVPAGMSFDLSFGDRIDGFSMHTARYGGNEATHEKKLWGRATTDDTSTVDVGDWIKDIQAGKADEGRKELSVVLSVHDDTPNFDERTDVPEEAQTSYYYYRKRQETASLTSTCVPGDDGCAADGYSMTFSLGAKKDGKIVETFPPNVQLRGGGDGEQERGITINVADDGGGVTWDTTAPTPGSYDTN